MDYSKYTFNQLTEALAAMDKNAYPDNYKALSAAIQEFPSERLQTEVFIDQVSPMGINQLKIKLVETTNSAHRKIIEEIIQDKSNRLTRVKIWFKWISIILVAAIASAFIPKDFKSVSAILVLLIIVGSVFMAIRQHRAFNKKISKTPSSSESETSN